MTNVNKLQLVDVNKLNAILEMLKKKNENEKIIDSIKNPDFLSIEEKRTNMEKIDARQDENIVEFLKKKYAIKRGYDEKEEKKKKQEEENENENDSLIKKRRLAKFSSNVQQQYSEQLTEFFESKKFRESPSGRMKIGNVSVNKKDLLYDLTHQAVKDSSFNLSSEERVNVLKELKKTGMPASNIRNTSLKRIYITGVRKNFGESSFFTSSEEEEPGETLFGKKKKSSLEYDRLTGRGRKK